MPADQAFKDEVLSLLEPLGEISARAMFGGFGVFHESAMFALIAGSGLFFKIDGTNREAYEAAGAKAYGRMPYYLVPADIMEDIARLHEWAQTSIDIGHATATKKKRRR